MHTPDFAVKYFGLMVAFVLLSTIFTGCGPSRQEIAEREAARQAAKQEILQIKAQLKKSAQLRQATGEQAPPQSMKDPGYEVVNCLEPKVAQDVVSIGSYVCGNTEAGSRIVDWRKWYCRGTEMNKERFEKCVLSEWKDGEPTFGRLRKYSETSAIAFAGESKPRIFSISPFRLK